MSNLFRRCITHIPRMWDWILLLIVLVIVIWLVAPQQLSVMAYKLALVSMAAIISPWIFIRLYRRASDRTLEEGQERRQYNWAIDIAKAIIFLACVLGLTLGL